MSWPRFRSAKFHFRIELCRFWTSFLPFWEKPMTRLISFLVAVVVLLSASAEIASFGIEHRSWLQENYHAAREYLASWIHPAPGTSPPCEGDCAPPAQKVEAPRCDGIEPLAKKVLCYVTIPRADTGCSARDCPPGAKPPPLPKDWIRNGKKGDVASVPPAN
jgi:hypothetical protein